MKKYTLELTQNDLAVLQQLIVAAGKSEKTGTAGFVAALQGLDIINRAKEQEDSNG